MCSLAAWWDQHLSWQPSCTACNGYYGPCFGEPVCATCHAFLYASNLEQEINIQIMSEEHDSSEDDYDSGNDEPSDYFPLERRPSTSHTPASQQEGSNEPDQANDLAVIDLPEFIPHIDLDGLLPVINMDDIAIRPLEFPRRVSHSVHVESLNDRLQLLSTNHRVTADVAPAGLVEALPPEVVLVIFGHLDDISLYAVGNVCRRWRQLLRSQSSPHQWHMYTRRRWPLYQPLSTVTDWFTIFSTLIDSSFCRSCIYQMSEVIPNDMDSPPMREKRLGHDLRGLAQDAPEGIEAQPLDSCYYHWQASITGPVGSPYEGGVFYLYLKVPFTYPFDPPEVRFLTKIFHPNVSRHGDVGIDSIQQANWVSGLTIPKVLISIQSLLTDPFCDVCMEPEVAMLYKNDKQTFDSVARSWTWKYAMHDVLMPKTRA